MVTSLEMDSNGVQSNFNKNGAVLNDKLKNVIMEAGVFFQMLTHPY